MEKIEITPGGGDMMKEAIKKSDERVLEHPGHPAGVGNPDLFKPKPDPEQVKKAQQGLEETLKGIKKMKEDGVTTDFDKQI